MKYLILILILSGCENTPILNSALAIATAIKLKDYCINTPQEEIAKNVALIKLHDPDYVGLCD